VSRLKANNKLVAARIECLFVSRGLAGRVAAGRRVVAGPGGGLPEEPVFWGVIRPRWLQSRSPIASRVPDLICSAPCVCAEAGEDGVADLALERPQCLPVGLALGQLLGVVGAPLAVGLTDLVSRNWASMRRRSSTTASSQRAAILTMATRGCARPRLERGTYRLGKGLS
jgi:hypothetical protein